MEEEDSVDEHDNNKDRPVRELRAGRIARCLNAAFEASPSAAPLQGGEQATSQWDGVLHRLDVRRTTRRGQAELDDLRAQAELNAELGRISAQDKASERRSHLQASS